MNMLNADPTRVCPTPTVVYWLALGFALGVMLVLGLMLNMRPQ